MFQRDHFNLSINLFFLCFIQIQLFFKDKNDVF